MRKRLFIYTEIMKNGFYLLEELNEIFSKFTDDPNLGFINVDRLTDVVRAFGRNPTLRDSAERINELELAGKKIVFI